MQAIQREPIAIIGIGCRFPAAENPQQFWQLLREGKNAICEIPTDRWNIDALYDPDTTRSGKMMSRWGGFINTVDQFDWRMFRILPREAKYIDPQHRLLLEVTWEALEDAGLPLAQVAGSRTSVSVGISWNDYLRLQCRNWSQLDGYSVVGNPYSFAANRISYIFDLKGPSIALDAGCTSSLASIYFACQSLWTGEATLALAGGVNLMLSPDSMIMMSKAGLLSPDGRCKALDAKADGCVRGEGAGIIVLKSLSQVGPADRVYALIGGITLNHNGHNEWIMGTSASAQEVLLREAYYKAGIDPAEVDYVELHGTGFLRGDPIEAKALGTVLGTGDKREHPCRIGSLKTNIGNLESAAGVASVIKVALSLYHRELPPTLNLQTINPAIPLHDLQLEPQRVLSPWPQKEGRLTAGVNTLSFTGANGHAILTAPPPVDKDDVPLLEQNDTQPLRLLPLSARSEKALYALATAFKDVLTSEEAIKRSAWQDICYTASVRRTHHQYRLVVQSHTSQEAVLILESLLEEKSKPDVVTASTMPTEQHKLMFLFAHQSSHWDMIEDTFLCNQPIFQAVVEKCERVFGLYTGRSLREGQQQGMLLSQSGRTLLNSAIFFTLQVGLAALWHSWGIVPDAVLGEGLGEIAAAHVAGVLTLEDAMKLLTSYGGKETSQEDWDRVLSTLRPATAAIPFYSTTVGFVGEDDYFAPSQRNKHTIEPNLSVEIFDQLLEEGQNVFVELGPSSVLSGAIFARLEHHGRTGKLLPSLRQGGEAGAALLEALATLYASGYEINWSTLPGNSGRCVSLPTYPWQRERIWLDWLDVETISRPPELQNGRSLEQERSGLQVQESGQNLQFLPRLEELPSNKRFDLLLSYVMEQVISVLELDPACPPSIQQKLFELGMDSLTATQLTNRLQVSLKRPLSATTVFHYPTIESLSDYLAREILSASTSTSDNGRHVAKIRELSETETEALLMEKFAVIEQLMI